MGGHPQAKTPNIDRLAARGVLFNNAHCQSPVCNPSRASMMTSLYPATTGIYFLNPDLAKSPLAKKNTLMPQRFQDEGIRSREPARSSTVIKTRRYLPNWAGSFGGFGPSRKRSSLPFPGFARGTGGCIRSEMNRCRITRSPPGPLSSSKRNKTNRVSSPLDSTARMCRSMRRRSGLICTHWSRCNYRRCCENDLDDVSDYGINLTRLKHVAPTHEWVVKNDEWKPLVQSYLACVSFVDHQVGKVLDALDNSPAKDNTLIILYSDHGFHLGEKERWAKRSLWEDSTRVPLIVAGPGVAQGKVCSQARASCSISTPHCWS